MTENKRAFLIILDGWGLGPVPESDAILKANTSFMDGLMNDYPNSRLTTYGEEVGLPDGQMGNSEVGHLNIGAGRIVWQELARINKAIRDRELHENQTYLDALSYAREHNKSVHLLGLVSDGGVHSHINHLKALCDIAHEAGNSKVFVHAFTDGRDCDPKSGEGFIQELENHLSKTTAQLATVTGRYYAMDRDKRWERVKLAYDCLVNGKGEQVSDFPQAIRTSYNNDITDEFLKPMLREGLSEEGLIREGDVVLCFNFRTDRLRELTEVLSQNDMHEHNMHKLDLRYLTMTRYDNRFEKVSVLFEKEDVRLTMGEVIEQAGKTQVRIAETEKYPHVTFFFSGGREKEFEGERRILIPSPKVATYDLQPEMSAYGITDAIMQDIRNHEPDFICLNFANTDMVGHTGVFSAAIKAAETVDHCMSQIIPLALRHNYNCIIIADHGNSDFMINEDGTPNTAHTMNPVPCILVGNQAKESKLVDGKLADVAPTLLKLMGLEKPELMSGESLLR